MTTKKVVRAVMGLAMIAIGILHFVKPDGFVKIVPAWLPAPLLLVQVSGLFEVLGGVGLFVPRARRAAAWGLIALYIAVFPANVNMAVNHLTFDGIPEWALWVRLPFQAVFVALAFWMTRPDPAPRGA